MSAISSRSLRLACDLGSPDAALDPRTNLPPAVLRGSDLLLQVAAFRDWVLVSDVSNYATLTAIIRAVAADGSLGESLSTVTLAGADLEECTLETWIAGTAQHAEFALDGDDLNLAAGRYKLTVYGITSATPAVRVPWAHAVFTIIEAGLVDGTPPTPSSDYYTKPEADAAFIQLAPVDGGFRIRSDGLFVQLKDSVSGKFRSIWFESGALVWGEEED
jgi:hypothetical protein